MSACLVSGVFVGGETMDRRRSGRAPERRTSPAPRQRSPVAVMPCMKRAAARGGSAVLSGGPRTSLGRAAASPSPPAAATPSPSLPIAQRRAEAARTLKEVSDAVRVARRLSAEVGSTGGRVAEALRAAAAAREGDDDTAGGRSPQLAAARAAKKGEVRAVERSQRFTASVTQKLGDLCDDLASCSTSCRSESPRAF